MFHYLPEGKLPLPNSWFSGDFRLADVAKLVNSDTWTVPPATHSSLDFGRIFFSLSLTTFQTCFLPDSFYSSLFSYFPSLPLPLFFPFSPFFLCSYMLLKYNEQFLGHYSAGGLVHTAESWAPMPTLLLTSCVTWGELTHLTINHQSNPSSLQQASGNNEEIYKTKSCAHNLGWFLSYLRVFNIKQSTQRNELTPQPSY